MCRLLPGAFDTLACEYYTWALLSVSTAALPVLAGVLTADLEVARAGRTEIARQSEAKDEMIRLKRGILGDVLCTWQDRWQSETKVGELFFPPTCLEDSECAGSNQIMQRPRY